MDKQEEEKQQVMVVVLETDGRNLLTEEDAWTSIEEPSEFILRG